MQNLRGVSRVPPIPDSWEVAQTMADSSPSPTRTLLGIAQDEPQEERGRPSYAERQHRDRCPSRTSEFSSLSPARNAVTGESGLDWDADEPINVPSPDKDMWTRCMTSNCRGVGGSGLDLVLARAASVLGQSLIQQRRLMSI